MAVWRSAGNVHIEPFCFCLYFFNKDSFHLFSFSLKCDLWRSPCLLFGPKKSLYYIIFFGGFLKHCNYSIRISLMLHFFFNFLLLFHYNTFRGAAGGDVEFFISSSLLLGEFLCVFLNEAAFSVRRLWSTTNNFLIIEWSYKLIIPVFFFIFCL